MVVNDNVGLQKKRGALECIASRLAPTGVGGRLPWWVTGWACVASSNVFRPVADSPGAWVAGR
ncbi:hypothetical protein C1X35_32025 [Pseudomonas sp. FW306-1C-G01A]|nr:hypothetical protein C1X51_31520 [Pseudomonas sp. FW306-2-2C-B10A]PMV85304.1 hypothetical protein C1X56_19190 [Pseudomonas sp. GW101-1A09]PMV93411.1 hypothetical protein C1X55_26430 [Pseudomonas sp. GW460-C8]PMV96169.1 hypothetical protein C1X50_32055 [Pseudomonas sp. MPR-TSA4]PMW05932.1 hypothetical protein C1X52_31485 [Pseudomonas sp. FW306-2-1A-C05A]PMW10643.1 hypothetical protein C1X53_32850 [Pseudomonas sp. GW456-E6]PMW15188.1 hypothetical protein C1X40_21045 [Pseudomonas sp. GW456-11